jgi:uncharacterized protein YbbC (DUF1343 family)
MLRHCFIKALKKSYFLISTLNTFGYAINFFYFGWFGNCIIIPQRGKMLRKLSIFCIVVFISCTTTRQFPIPTKNKIASPSLKVNSTPPKMLLGSQNFLQNFLYLVQNKRVGLITNPSAVDRQLNTTADILYEHPKVNLTALYAPEHGIRGAVEGGATIEDNIDSFTGLPVFSLYGKNKKPTAQMLENIDILIFEIQDIGIRSYTYIYTMAKAMEAAAEFKKKIIIFDRPNPIGGIEVEGNLLEDAFFSFIGLYPIPYRHGMTIGELAQLFNEAYAIHCDLTVIPMQHYTREMLWPETGLIWVPTSPHVPHWRSIFYLAATGALGELHTLSEGVGYTSPFQLIGAPWIKSYPLAAALNQLRLPGIIFRPVAFKPYYARFKGKYCGGVQLHITDYLKFKPYVTGLHILQTIIDLYPEQNMFKNADRVSMFHKAVGTDKMMKALESKLPVNALERNWQLELENFKKMRKKYLIYQPKQNLSHRQDFSKESYSPR